MAQVDTAAVAALGGRVQREVDEGHIPSGQFALAHDGEVVARGTFGAADDASRYVIASATKPVVASVIWLLLDEGAVALDMPIADLWPAFAANGKGTVTLEHVLLHTCGFPSADIPAPAWHDRGLRVESMQRWELEWEPGSRFVYHPASAHWVLAEVIELATGLDYRAAVRSRVLDPLDLPGLELGVPVPRQGTILPLSVTGEPPSPERVREALGFDLELPDVTDLVELIHTPEGRAAGMPGGGAVSDAASLARFYQALLHDPPGLWAPWILKEATANPRNQLEQFFPGGPAPASRTIGLELAGDDRASRYRIGLGATSPSTFGHGGAGGQIAWADPVTGVSFAFLTNGMDRDFIREHRRSRELCELAVRCVRA